MAAAIRNPAVPGPFRDGHDSEPGADRYGGGRGPLTMDLGPVRGKLKPDRSWPVAVPCCPGPELVCLDPVHSNLWRKQPGRPLAGLAPSIWAVLSRTP